MDAFDDKLFFRQYASDPNRAFRMLMDGFRDRVFITCKRATKNDQDAQDLAQEVFIRVWKGIPKFERKSSLSTWIYHIAWNVCASHIEKKGSTPLTNTIEDEFNNEEGSSTIILSEEDEGFEVYEKRQYLAKLYKALPDSHRLILTLFYVQEQTYDEIVKITGWPIGTVKATLHRAKANLRKAALAEEQAL